MVKQTRHIFLDLPKLSGDLQAYIDATSQLGGWSSNCVQVRARALGACGERRAAGGARRRCWRQACVWPS